MLSLTVTFAKGLKLGRVQIKRYHLRVLKTVREVKHGFQYVLFNQQTHEKGTYSAIDDYSSVLTLEKSLGLVRKFAKRNSKTIRIQKSGPWIPDPGKSYLYKKGLLNLFF